jgi:hypothetical protein
MNPEPSSSAILAGFESPPPPPPPSSTVTGPPPRCGPTNAQYFLGLFVLWQLFFLFASNVLTLGSAARKKQDLYLSNCWKARINWLAPGWLDRKDENKGKFESRGHEALDILYRITLHWEQLSAQSQSWSLFAPAINREVTFLAVQLRWDDLDWGKPAHRGAPHAPELLLSENEPPDPSHFFRWGQFRLRKYEGSLDVILRVRKEDNEKLAAAVERWRDIIHDQVKDEWDTITAYLRMRCRDYMDRHPGLPQPKQVILLVRQFAIPEPGQFSEAWYKEPQVVPMARWRPGPPKGGYEVEWFKPRLDAAGHITGSFESLP